MADATPKYQPWLPFPLEGGVTFQPTTRTYEVRFANDRPSSGAILNAFTDDAIIESICMDRYRRDGIIAVSVFCHFDDSTVGDYLQRAVKEALSDGTGAIPKRAPQPEHLPV